MKPHVIYSEAHRSKVDVNRDQAEATFGNQAALALWQQYHAYIDAALNTVQSNGEILLIDISGEVRCEPSLFEDLVESSLVIL